jgi:hypothetical protein
MKIQITLLFKQIVIEMDLVNLISLNDPSIYNRFKSSKPKNFEQVIGPKNKVYKAYNSTNLNAISREIKKKTGLEVRESSSDSSKASMYYPLPTIEIPVNTIFHRADWEGIKLPSTNVPAFFGNRESINIYTRGKGNSVVSSYRTKTPLVLFNMNPISLIWLSKIPQLTEDEKNYMKQYFIREGELAFVIPTIPFPSEALQQNYKQKKERGEEAYLPYLNRLIAGILCRLGFDGWIVRPYNPEKGDGLLQYSMVRNEVFPYSPEIMVCNWNTKMEAVKRGGRFTRKQKS